MNIETIRHSLSHIMAYAVQEMYPGVKFGIGPAIENGFYYDFGNLKISDSDLPKIEKKMKDIIKRNLKFEKRELEINEAIKLFKKLNQSYKIELINDLKKESKRLKNKKFHLIAKQLQGAKRLVCVSSYKLQDFIDLCKGPHIKSTLQLYSGQAKEIIDAFKLTKIAGAYWRGDEKNPMLTRIYGTAFPSKKELEDYIKLQKEAEKRDHRVLGQKLELFLFDEEVGAGLPLWMPKGAVLRKIIEDYLYKELESQGYQFLITPHIGKLSLWKTSGHWDLYRENMYSPIEIEEEKYELKPMNCPFHVKVYKSKIRSYKDLPLKYAEFGTVYRYEKSGVLHGLIRVRGFTQDDAHIWCAPEQLNKEIEKLLKQGLAILKTFGFKQFNIYISTRPEKYAGKLKDWQKATNTLKYVLNKQKLKYQIDSGGGVFYGPKIDIKIKDSIGREWQCTTIQVDFNLPEKFDITYVNKKGKKEKPYMLHRALIGSLERFIGVLLEHYEGALPLWLSPVQALIIPVASRHKKYAKEIGKMFQVFPPSARILDRIGTGFRFQVKDDNETVSKKIRDGEIQKIPYLLVVGDKEIRAKSVRVRERKKGDIGMLKTDKFIEKIKKEVENKK